MGLGLALVAVGLATLWSATPGLAILAVGMGIYLVGVMITVVGISLVYSGARPRPNFIWLRWSLLHDAVHARSARAEQVAEGTDSLVESYAQSRDMENLRHSAHWWLAVWGVRAMGPSLAVVVAGLVILLWSTAPGRVVLSVGIGIYLLGIVFSFVEVHQAYSEMEPPRPEYARVRQALWHDALHARS